MWTICNKQEHIGPLYVCNVQFYEFDSKEFHIIDKIIDP